MPGHGHTHPGELYFYFLFRLFACYLIQSSSLQRVPRTAYMQKYVVTYNSRTPANTDVEACSVVRTSLINNSWSCLTACFCLCGILAQKLKKKKWLCKKSSPQVTRGPSCRPFCTALSQGEPVIHLCVGEVICFCAQPEWSGGLIAAARTVMQHWPRFSLGKQKL